MVYTIMPIVGIFEVTSQIGFTTVHPQGQRSLGDTTSIMSGDAEVAAHPLTWAGLVPFVTGDGSGPVGTAC